MEIRVLILEDDDDDLILILRELKKASFQPNYHRIMTEQELRAALNNGPWDVAIIDYYLPGFSGQAALKIIQESNKNIPCIVVSGAISEEEAITMMRNGSSDYVFKDRIGRLGQSVQYALKERAIEAERQRALENLKSSEAKFRAIYEHALDGMILIDLQTATIIDINPMITVLLYYEPIDLIGQSVETIFPKELTADYQEVLQLLKTNSPTTLTQLCRRKDDVFIPFDVNATVIPWGDQRVILVTIRDITDRLQFQMAVDIADDYHARWEHERELVTLKSRFVSMVSHEFRTPLSSIQLSVDMLERYYDRMTSEKRAERFRTIRQEIQRMDRLIEDVLLVGKSETGAIQPSRQMINLVEFCEKTFQHIQDQLGKQHHMVFEANQDVINASVDPNLLRHTLDNLLTNAIKYTPPGGDIQFHLHMNGENNCQIIITDSGIGIPKADQDRIFSSFFRASNVAERKGTGLGLSIAKQMVELHGGTIEFKSEEGKGTTFTITLPCA
ncbi:MAG: PAS domain S-box protein [Chloroflexi bacterium]|nr:MAG: PAS domain S-box protein [Chloroflexota bacterium]